jgi:hypothetical protein
MSYDFRLFLPQSGVDALVTAQVEPRESGPPVPAKEARKRAIVEALMKADPALEVFQFGFDEIAKSQNIRVDEAKVRFRHLELNGPEDGPGIQITLFDDDASLTVPYWHTDKKAKAVFAQIWEYLKVIQRVAGYQIYDPQMECIMDSESTLERAAKCYERVSQRF